VTVARPITSATTDLLLEARKLMFSRLRLGAAFSSLALALLLSAVPARAADPPPARAGDSTPAFDKLLPNDTEMVFTIKVKALFDSKLAKDNGVTAAVKDLLGSVDEAQSVLKDLNFDPMTDVEQITVAICSGSDPDKGLVIVRGKFDVEKFRAKADEAAKDYKDVLTIHKAPDGMGGQHLVYEVAAPGSSQSIFVAFAGKNALLLGAAKDYVLDALDKETGKKKTELKNKEVQALLGRLDPKLTIALAIPAKTLADNPQIPEQAKDVLDKMSDIVVGVEFDKDVKVKLVVTAKKATDAASLHQTISKGANAATAALALLVDNQPALEPVLDIIKSIKPKMKDKTITIDAAVSGDLVEKLLKNLKP
jgi:hypothetical protein